MSRIYDTLGAFDWEIWIRISDLQSNAKSENSFQRCNICFWFSFLPFDWEIRKRIRKTVLRNSGLACTRIISKKKTAVQENSFANPFSDFPIEPQKGKSKKSGFGFLNWIHPEDGFLGDEIRFRIWRSIGKSRFRFWKSKCGFPNRTHPLTTWKRHLVFTCNKDIRLSIKQSLYI